MLPKIISESCHSNFRCCRILHEFAVAGDVLACDEVYHGKAVVFQVSCVVHQWRSHSGVKAPCLVLTLEKIKLLIASWLMIRTLWKWGSGAELRQLEQRSGAVGAGRGGAVGYGEPN